MDNAVSKAALTTHNNQTFEHWIRQLATLPGLFMTGTDTGVGKTWVGVQLLQYLRLQGARVQPRKPAESGWPADHITATDSWKLATCGHGFHNLDTVCPYRLSAPLSPPRAAMLDGIRLSIQQLAQHCQQSIRPDDFLYVEGAGGFYSPLAEDGLNADLAKALELPVVLVVADKLGCINHTLLTVDAVEKYQLELAGIILNDLKAPVQLQDGQTDPEADMDNLQDLRQLRPDIPVLRLPKSP